MKQQFAQIDWDEDIVEGEHGESVFAYTGLSAVVCTGYAMEVLRRLGAERVKVYGFFADDNPKAKIGQVAEGHDFALVDDKFIVDPWIATVESVSDEFVFELGVDDQVIAELYGEKDKWTQIA